MSRRHLANIYDLGVKELWSLWRDPMMLVLIIYVVTASVYTAGGELSSIRQDGRTLVAGTDYTVAAAANGADTVTFSRGYLDALPLGETTLSLTVGAKTLSLTLTKVTPADPSLSASAGGYDKTEPSALPQVGIATPGGNQLTAVRLGDDPQIRERDVTDEGQAQMSDQQATDLRLRLVT